MGDSNEAYTTYGFPRAAGFIVKPGHWLSGSSRYFQLADVAAWSVLLEKKLNTAGLANVAAPYITSMEQLTARLDTSGASTNFDRYSKEKENLLRKLADQLNKAAAEKGIRSLRFTVEGGCGAGELLYRVAVTPPSAKVHIIKTFYYMLCQARGVDPLDLQNCYGWQDVLSAQLEGAGGYRFVALWPDGKQQSGSFEVTKAAVGRMDDSKLNVITINISR